MLQIKGSNFTDNYAVRKTQGVSLTQSFVKFKDCLFKNSSTDPLRYLEELTGSFVYISEQSIVEILQSEFTGARADSGGAVSVKGFSQLKIKECVFYRNQALHVGGDIYGSGYTSLKVEQSKFSNSSQPIALVSSPHQAVIKDNVFTGYFNQGNIIFAEDTLVSFENNTVQGFIAQRRSVIICSNTHRCLINQSSFKNIIAERVISIIWTDDYQLLSSSTQKVSNNVFENVDSREQGPALLLYNTNAVVQFNSFLSLSNAQFDQRGGAIYIQGESPTEIKIEHNLFYQCSAYIGGAIAFEDIEPQFNNNTYQQNVALLSGPDIASYPQTLRQISEEEYFEFQDRLQEIQDLNGSRYKIQDAELKELILEQQAAFVQGDARSLSASPNYQNYLNANWDNWNQFRTLSFSPKRGTQSAATKIKSGTALSDLYFALFDNYDNIIYDRDFRSRSLQASLQTQQGSTITGIISNYRQPDEEEGIFVVQRITITAEPDTNIELIFSASIDGLKSLSNLTAQTTKYLTVLPCKAGQAFLATGECEKCDPGYYLLEAPEQETLCAPCPQNAVCYGGSKIGPLYGYWRSSAQSVNFIQCFNKDACRGSSESDDKYDPQGTCADGYKGILCAQCENKYVRNGRFQCGKCPSQTQNILLLLAAVIGITGGLVIFIKITLSSMQERKSPFSAYFKIMTNHMHLIFLTASFDLSWPQVISEFFNSTEPVANISDRIISFDCFIDSTVFDRVARPYIYLLIYLFMPLFIVLISLAIWGLIYRRHKVTMCNRTITTSIVLLFLVHPSITTLLIRVFHCYKIDDDFHLVHDLELECWTSSHLTWALGGALPGILMWGIGIPLASLLLLYCSRSNLESPRVKEKYGFLYNGYRVRLYYWESVIMFRKVAMIFITVFLSSLGRIVQALAVILLLIFYLFYTIRNKPYITRRLNQLEITSLLTSSITIYCGVFFLSSRDATDPSFTPNRDMILSQETKWVLVFAILVANAIFLILWTDYIVKDLRYFLAMRYPRLFRCCCLCCRKSLEKRSIMRISKHGQDFEVINLIEDVESDLSRIKYKYVFNQKFKDKWEFQDYLITVEEKLKRFDTHTLPRKRYRKQHSLKDSIHRIERSTGSSKNERVRSSPSNQHLGQSQQQMNTRGAKEEEMMIEVSSIRPHLELKMEPNY